jgi:hypothetical protein
MSNILRAEVDIVGTRLILWHYFGPDAISLDKREEKTGVAGNDPEEWRGSVLVTRDGQLYMLPTYVFSALRNGAKYTKRGRASLFVPLSATLQVISDLILIDRYMPGFPNGHAFDVKAIEPPPMFPIFAATDEPVYLSFGSVVNPKTRMRNVRYRIAASSGWRTTFKILWDKTIISRGEMQAIAIDTGKLVGLADGRSIGLGRFDIERFEVVED